MSFPYVQNDKIFTNRSFCKLLAKRVDFAKLKLHSMDKI